MHLVRLTVAVAAVLLAASCAATKPTTKDTGMGGIITLPIKPSVFVRAAFDADGTDLIGAFIPDDVEDTAIDETVAGRTRCSRFITPVEVRAEGRVEDVFSSGTSIGGGVGVDGIAKIKGERKDSNALRIIYDATRKLQAKVDEDGLYNCCQQMPDQCPKRYISSAIAGSGRIYVATEQSNEAGVEAAGSLKGLPVVGDILYKDGLKWERKTNFPDQYFAFSIRRSTPGGMARAEIPVDCSWRNRVPSSYDGIYFVGVSEPAASESLARRDAMEGAKRQVIQYLGEWMTDEAKRNERFGGAFGGIGGEIDSEASFQRSSQGLAKFVKDRAWCDGEKVATPDGTLRVMNVLAYLPNAELKAASRIHLASVMELLREKGQLTPGRESALRQALAELGGAMPDQTVPAIGSGAPAVAPASGTAAPGTTRLPPREGRDAQIPEFSEDHSQKPEEGKPGALPVNDMVEKGKKLIEAVSGTPPPADGARTPPASGRGNDKRVQPEHEN